MFDRKLSSTLCLMRSHPLSWSIWSCAWEHDNPEMSLPHVLVLFFFLRNESCHVGSLSSLIADVISFFRASDPKGSGTERLSEVDVSESALVRRVHTAWRSRRPWLFFSSFSSCWAAYSVREETETLASNCRAATANSVVVIHTTFTLNSASSWVLILCNCQVLMELYWLMYVRRGADRRRFKSGTVASFTGMWNCYRGMRLSSVSVDFVLQAEHTRPICGFSVWSTSFRILVYAGMTVNPGAGLATARGRK